MNLDKKLKKAYNQKVTKPNGQQEVVERISVKKTHHTLFRTLKITGLVAASLVGTLVLSMGGYIIATSLHTISKDQSIKKARFSIYDTKLLQNETFKMLNSISYTEELENNPIDENFINKVNEFASNSFMLSDQTSSVAYSPLMLYTQLDLISCAVSDEETKAQFDNALLINDASTRQKNIYNAMKNNFFVQKENKNTVQAKNAVFVEQELGAADQFVNDMTSRNTEVYEMDFHSKKDVESAADWINQSVNEPNFVDPNYFELQDDSALLFASTLYFDNSWRQKYKVQDTKEDDFHLIDGNTARVKFMNHAYFGPITEYDKYVSLTDYYSSGYSIQYYVPKNIKDSIFELLPNNFLSNIDSAENKHAISLSLPKFSLTCDSRLTDMIKTLGVTNPYVFRSNHLKNAFKAADDLEYSYLVYTKQKTNVSFDEDGTVVKSLTLSMGAAGKAARPMGDAYEVQLNQPFVYCIRDRQNLPLIVGSVQNPKA